jgi:ABC-2 type transport system ATP-binding protein
VSKYALRLIRVSKRYGKTRALDALDLDVPQGALFGLVGPNGAGKTTTFGVVSGAVRHDEGVIDVLGGGPFDPAKHAGRITVLPQDCELNPHSSARQLLTFYARLQGMSGKAAAKDADRVLELVRLTDRASSRVRQLSHGMRRRLAVAQALLGDPALVLLDEPTGGLDPHLVVEMRDVLREQRGKRTIVVSSHILADLEATCDHVAFIEAGRCVKSGVLEEVTKRGGLVRVRLAAPIDIEEGLLAGRAVTVEGDVLSIELSPGESAADVNRAVLPELFARGAQVLEVRLGESLEAAYMASRRSAAR